MRRHEALRIVRGMSPPNQHPEQVPYRLIGGDVGVKRLASTFYDVMSERRDAATIRAMHDEDLAPIKQRLYEFLSGWMGGPPLAQLQNRHVCMFSAHAPYAIGPAERDAWMACMDEAMRRCALSPELTDLLHQAFWRMADGLARAPA